MADNNVEMQGVEIKITGDASEYGKAAEEAIKKTNKLKDVLQNAQKIYAAQHPEIKFNTNALDGVRKKLTDMVKTAGASGKKAVEAIQGQFAKLDTGKLNAQTGGESSGLTGLKDLIKRSREIYAEKHPEYGFNVKVKGAEELPKATRDVKDLRGALRQAANASTSVKAMVDGIRQKKMESKLPLPVNREEGSGGGTDTTSAGGTGQTVADIGEKATKASGGIKEFLSNLGGKLMTAAEKAAGALKKLGQALGSKVLGGLKKAGAAAKNLAKNLGSKLLSPVQKAVKGFNKLGKSVARVAMYRAIRAVLSSISQALKEGVGNIYQYSKAMDGKLASSLDSIATSTQYLKNSLGAVAAPIINAVAPAIDALVDKVVTLANAIAQLFAKLGGQTTFTKASKSATQYAEAAEGAAAANKDFTAGFDELNIISESKGGGGGSTADYGSMFEEAEIDSQIGSFADKLKEAFDLGEFENLGAMIADKLNGIIDSVDFEGWGNAIGEKVSNAISVMLGFLRTMDFVAIGQDLAQGLNGIMDSLNFEDIGALLAEKWNVLIDTIYGFVTTFDWGKFGTSLSQAVNSWFENIHLDTAAAALVAGINGVVDTVWNFLTGLDIGKITTTISSAVNKALTGIDFKKAGQTLSKAFKTVLDSITQTIQKIDWKQLGKDIADFVAGVDWTGVIDSLMDGIQAAAKGLHDFFVGLIGDAWDGLVSWWKDTAYEDGQFTMEGLLDGIAKKLESIYLWFKEHVFDPIINAFKNLFGIHSPSTVFEDLGGNLIEGLKQGISGMWESITTFFSDSWEDLKKGFTETWDNIRGSATEKWDTITGELSDSWNDIKETASEKWELVKGTIVDTWNDLDKSDLPSFISSLSGKLSEGWDSIKKTASEKWSNIKDTIVNFFKGTRDEVDGISEDIKDAAASASSAVSSIKGSRNKISAGGGYTAQAYASGGFVDQGSLFVARESGPELVGRIGGRTAVANNDQIVQAVASGVAGANSSVVSALYQLIDVVQNMDTSVVIGDDEIGRSYDRYSTGRGARVSSGAFANAY